MELIIPMFFFWRPNGQKHSTSVSYDTSNYVNTAEKLYIELDEFGNFDYKYNLLITSIDGAFLGNTYIKELYFEKAEGLILCTTANALFKDCTNLEVLNIDAFNTSNWKRIAGLFYNCKKLKSIDFSKVDLQNIFDVDYYMSQNKPFYGCSSLAYINCGSMFDKGIWTIVSFFSNPALKQIDNFFNKKIKMRSTVTVGTDLVDWRSAFSNCGLQVLDFRNMDFSEIDNKNTNGFEAGLYLSDFVKKGVCREVHFPDVKFRITTWYAFGDSSNSGINIEYLNLGGGYFSDVTTPANNLEYMFVYANKLNKIRCLQETKDYLIANADLAWLPSKFKTDDSLWEIVEIT